jgi:hypothetical protein
VTFDRSGGPAAPLHLAPIETQNRVIVGTCTRRDMLASAHDGLQRAVKGAVPEQLMCGLPGVAA